MERLQLDYVDVLQCRFHFGLPYCDLLKLMFDRALCIGHRFDQDTPIAETVRGSMFEVDDGWCNQLTCLNLLRCKRFMMSFKLDTYDISECLPAGHGNVCVSLSLDRLAECAIFIPHSPCNAK